MAKDKSNKQKQNPSNKEKKTAGNNQWASPPECAHHEHKDC